MPQLPGEFTAMIRSYGAAYAEPLLAALEAGEPAVSVRVNALKGGRVPADAQPVHWCRQGFYLPERPLFAADPAWHQGLYYVQEASSMAYSAALEAIVKDIFGTDAPLCMLDACAAPGGKSIAAIEALPEGSLVVSNELDRHRANILSENIAKEGADSTVVCRGDACRFGKLKAAFDIIAVDAPCSGEGMMRKEPEAARQWSQALIADCAATQREIVSRLWAALRPGGVMIYSTCTFNRSENEAMVEYIAAELGADSIDLGLDACVGVLKGIGTAEHCYRFAPGHIRGEGLFVAALRKHGEGTAAAPSKPKKAAAKAVAVPAEAKAWVDGIGSRYTPVAVGESIELHPAAHAAFIAEIASVTDVLRGGVRLCSMKGNKAVPAHELALSTALRREAFPSVELPYAEAMAYLRGESMAEVPEGLPAGFALATYGGVPLGFIKNIGRRANNLYPDPMRLRLDARALPESAPNIIEL